MCMSVHESVAGYHSHIVAWIGTQPFLTEAISAVDPDHAQHRINTSG